MRLSTVMPRRILGVFKLTTLLHKKIIGLFIKAKLRDKNKKEIINDGGRSNV